MSYYRKGNYGIRFGPGGASSVAFASALAPVAFSSKVVVTGHSVPDNVFQWPWSGVIEDKGFTLDIDSTTSGSGGNVPILLATFPCGWGGSWGDIVGETSQDYTKAALVLGDSGKQFRFTDTNSSGAVTSDVVVLTVT